MGAKMIFTIGALQLLQRALSSVPGPATTIGQVPRVVDQLGYDSQPRKMINNRGKIDLLILEKVFGVFSILKLIIKNRNF